MKLNKHFASPVLLPDGTPEYAPSILTVVTHHHDEHDEPIVDPDTGEPTGDTEHVVSDYDTSETKLYPTAADYAQMGFLPVRLNAPSDPPEEGFHYEVDAAEPWVVEQGIAVKRNYVQVQDAPPPPPAVSDYDAAMERHLLAERTARGYTTREPDSYLSSSVPRWKQDAEDWVAHRDAVMEYALGVMKEYASTGAIPSLDEFVAGLPAIAWTYGEGK